MFQGKAHYKWHCPSPVPSPRAAEAIPVHKARGEGQGEGTFSILCNVRVYSASTAEFRFIQTRPGRLGGDTAGARRAYEQCLCSPNNQPKGASGEPLLQQWSREELNMIDETPKENEVTNRY